MINRTLADDSTTPLGVDASDDETMIPSKFLKIIAEFKKREYFYMSYISSLEHKISKTQQTCVASGPYLHTLKDEYNLALREAVLDPTTQLEVKYLRLRLSETETLLNRTKEMLQAQMFNGKSVTGQRLITKCKVLQEENNELGKSLLENELQPLTQTVAALKSHVSYLKSELRNLRELNSDMDKDNEALGAQVQELVSTNTALVAEKEALQQQVERLRDIVERNKRSPSRNRYEDSARSKNALSTTSSSTIDKSKNRLKSPENESRRSARTDTNLYENSSNNSRENIIRKSRQSKEEPSKKEKSARRQWNAYSDNDGGTSAQEGRDASHSSYTRDTNSRERNVYRQSSRDAQFSRENSRTFSSRVEKSYRSSNANSSHHGHDD